MIYKLYKEDMCWYSSVVTYKLLFDDTLCKDALSKLKQFQVGIPV